MKTEDIEDVLSLSGVLAQHDPDAAHSPYLIADLIDWADRRNVILPPPSAAVPNITMADTKPSKPKSNKATESPDSVPDPIVPSSDPSEPDF